MLTDYHMHFEYGDYDEEWVSLFFRQAEIMNLFLITLKRENFKKNGLITPSQNLYILWMNMSVL